MDAEAKTKWLEALRSGKYEQGKAYLKSNEDRYCCLGVLAKVMGDMTKDEFGRGTVEHSIYNLPLDYAGLTLRDKEVLIDMNDSLNKSFPEIADWIEEHL